ncbi:N-6 DNA methylase, partial [Synechococcus sp. AH-603-M21]|nr:N-6 DNA methylase [Synechococcus sp. AH-603-M21]
LVSDDLDRGSAQFGQEGRKRSPHSCLQECLNADDNANWGVLLSGDRLRLLHDNPSLVKPAYLAADLELLIEGGLHAEFAVLWLLLHSSRFQHPQTGSCVLDDWKQEAEASGERVLGALRDGVQSALESLGWGFLNHPSNGELREALQSGQLSRQKFHEQLLRLVYRFLFLFTTEDRNLLFPREVEKTDARRRIYREGYSVSRLRELAIKRSAYEGDYSDLWELQRLVFQQLSIGNSPLGLPGLGGLFSLEQCPDLQAAELWNGPLLRAIKAIGWFDADGSFTRVRYRDLNTEELGSVYEGLLELHPQLDLQGSQWQLSYGCGAGSDRKTTGSYYTPDALVQELIKSALIPVIDDRLSKAHGQVEQEQVLLKIKVIDPACGSGHFLLAAARRLAVALAQVRAGDDQPSEDDRQHALRDVVAHCIYAVDKNPMAVELCKVALWIEAIDPGKPLSFLDAHIQCGDSLVGVFDPKVLEEGIPDGAYKPLTGDNKTVCTSLKKENAGARKTISRGGSNRGIQGSLALSGTQPRSKGQEDLQAIEAMPETTLAETASKQAAYAQWLSDRGQDPETLAADLYTAAFFLAKTSDSRPTVPTTEHLLKLLAGQPVDEAMEEAVIEAAQNFRFFHWHLRFGEVMEQGGFDCVLGNPPWERIKLQEKEFFAARSEAIATAPNKAARERL